jgi:hypothetical protein
MKTEDSSIIRKSIKEAPMMEGRSKSHSEFQKARLEEMYFLTAWGCNANG